MAQKLKKYVKLGKPVRERAKRVADMRRQRINEERQRLNLSMQASLIPAFAHGKPLPLLSTLLLGLGVLARSASPGWTAPACELGKGYVAIDASQQLGEDFLRKIKGAGIATIIRFYDWTSETLPGKTLTMRELRLIAALDLSVAVIFQHNNDCLCTFMTKGRGRRDAQRAL